MQHLTIYGDFNCPYSYLASVRSSQLVGRGLVTVEWRAVEHAPTIPKAGCQVQRATAARLSREIDEVMSLAGTATPLALHVPRILPNTAAAVRAIASADPSAAPALRERIFTALWTEGIDIGDPSELAVLTSGREAREPAAAQHWRATWLGMDRPAVPLLMLATGIVLRGTDALERLEVIGAGGLPERRRRLRRARRAESGVRRATTRPMTQSRAAMIGGGPRAVGSLLGETAS